jgi:hypothetical protein
MRKGKMMILTAQDQRKLHGGTLFIDCSNIPDPPPNPDNPSANAPSSSSSPA